MNELQDDDVIARVRSALNEVTADSHGLVAADPPRPRMSAGRWMSVAAAAVLVAGAVAAIAINRGNSSEVATIPTELPPDTTVATSEPTLIRVETPWFRLVAADLQPRERVQEQCCRASLPGPLLSMAWSNGEKFLTMTEYPVGTVPYVSPDTDSSTLNLGGISATLGFLSFGLTDDERNSLAIQLVPGSGLPYLLPVDGWQLAAMGRTAGESRLVQMYTALNVDPLSSYLPTVTMSVGEYRGELDSLALWPDPQPITVAGYEGWKVTEGDGTVSAFWYVSDGNWATLRIDAKLADRADALIIGVIQVNEDAANEPTVDTVLAPTVDTAIAETVPTPSDPTAPDPASAELSVGDVLTGELLPVATAGPALFVFVSASCVPCDQVVRTLVAAGRPEGEQLRQIALVIADPIDDTGVNDWLTDLGWTGIAIRDPYNLAVPQFGIDAVPSYVLVSVDSNGTILSFRSGLFTSSTLTELGIR